MNIKKEFSNQKVLILLFSINFVANFARMGEFGFYDDDWPMLASRWGNSVFLNLKAIAYNLMSFRLGRPFQFLFTGLVGLISSVFQSVTLLYVIIFILTSIAAYFFYKALRIKNSKEFSLFAAVIYLISPLTTLRAYLNANSYKAFGVIILFSAILLFSKRSFWSYAWAFILLFTQESLFFLYLACPILVEPLFSKRLPRRFLTHLFICFSLLAVALLLRVLAAEARINQATSESPSQAIYHLLSLPFIYAWKSFFTYLFAVENAFKGINTISIFTAVATGAVFTVFLNTYKIWGLNLRSSGVANERKFLGLLDTFVTGVIFLVAGYALIYFEWLQEPYFPYAGRSTRYSTMATFGSSIVVCSLVFAIQWKWLRSALQWSIISILLAYSFLIQKEFAQAWSSTKSFFQSTVKLTPDFNSQTPIIVLIKDLYRVPMIPSSKDHSIGSEPFGYEFIISSLNPNYYLSRIIFMTPDWQNELTVIKDGSVFWNPKTAIPWRFELMWKQRKQEYWRPGNFIVLALDSETQILSRSYEPVLVDGVQIVKINSNSKDAPDWADWKQLLSNHPLAKILGPIPL